MFEHEERTKIRAGLSSRRKIFICSALKPLRHVGSGTIIIFIVLAAAQDARLATGPEPSAEESCKAQRCGLSGNASATTNIENATCGLQCRCAPPALVHPPMNSHYPCCTSASPLETKPSLLTFPFLTIARLARSDMKPDRPRVRALKAPPVFVPPSPVGCGSTRARAISCHNPIQATQPLGLCRSL